MNTGLRLLFFNTGTSFNARLKSLIVTQVKLSSKLLLPQWTMHFSPAFPDPFLLLDWLLQKYKFGIHKKKSLKKLNLSNQMAEFQLNQVVPGLLDMSPLPVPFLPLCYILRSPQTPSRRPDSPSGEKCHSIQMYL